MAWAAAPGERAVLLSMEEPQAGRLVHELRHADPAIAVVALLPEPAPRAYIRALRQGVDGAAPRQAAPDLIAAVVRAASKGQALVPTTVLQAVAETAPESQVPAWITPEQVELLRHLDQGRTLPAIAKRMQVSERTLSRRLADLLAGMGVRTRAQALGRAHRWGLLDDPTHPE